MTLTERDRGLSFPQRIEKGASDPGAPSPSAMPQHREQPTTWIVKLTSGDQLRILADSHHTYVRPSGEELRFTNTDANGGPSHSVATIAAGLSEDELSARHVRRVTTADTEPTEEFRDFFGFGLDEEEQTMCLVVVLLAMGIVMLAGIAAGGGF